VGGKGGGGGRGEKWPKLCMHIWIIKLKKKREKKKLVFIWYLLSIYYVSGIMNAYVSNTQKSVLSAAYIVVYICCGNKYNCHFSLA
jgi:hypothetical protein